MTRPTRPGLLVSRGGSFLASAEAFCAKVFNLAANRTANGVVKI
jgi:hypothetical protein